MITPTGKKIWPISEPVDRNTPEWLDHLTRLAKSHIDQNDIDAAEALTFECSLGVRDKLLTNIVVYLWEKNCAERAFKVAEKIHDQLAINERLSELMAQKSGGDAKTANSDESDPCPMEEVSGPLKMLNAADNENMHLNVIRTCIDIENYERAVDIIDEIPDPIVREKAFLLLYRSFESPPSSQNNPFLIMPANVHEYIYGFLDDSTRKVCEVVSRKFKALYKIPKTAHPTWFCTALASTGNFQVLE